MTTPIPATVADTERALNILRDLKLWMVGKPAGPNQSVDAVIEILTIAAGAPAETAKAVDMDVVRTIAEVISNGASVQGVKFALQLLGVPVCYGCDYVKAHCRCVAPQIDATTALANTSKISSSSPMACSVCYGTGRDVAGKRCPFDCAPVAPVTAPDVAKDAARLAIEEALEGVEILTDFMRSVEKHGNYSVEATLTFIGQAKQCFAAMGALPPAGSEK